MDDVTLLLQGNVKQEVLDFFLLHYPSQKIVISTWFEHVHLTFPEKADDIPQDMVLLRSKLPVNVKRFNIYYQLVSTVNGLKHVDTKYVIKIRGDEFVSRLEYVLELMQNDSDRIFTSPVFFRKWSVMTYHISDHLVAGTTENIKTMFEGAKDDYDMNLFDNVTYIPEQVITLAYLKRKARVPCFATVDGAKLMRDHFGILDLSKMIPYKIVANCFKKEWYSNFVPADNDSITNIQDI